MSEAPVTKIPNRPWHLWLAGIAGGLWSVMGVVSFLLTRMKVESVMSRYPPQERAYFESLPSWAVACWAIGVFGGVTGCLLLLLRKSAAFPVLLASALGATVANLGPLFFLGGMEAMGGESGMAFITPVAGAILAFYARAMCRKGVLR